MARAWLVDRWLRDATVTGDDGVTLKVPPDSRALRSLSAASDPLKARVPERWRTTVYGQGKRWRVNWYSLDDDGRKHLHGRNFARKGEAEQYRDAVSGDLNSGRYRQPVSKTFGEAASEWLTSKTRVKQVTKDRLERELNIYVLPKWGSVPLTAITEADVNAWIGDLSKGTAPHHYEDAKRKGFKLSAGTIRHVVGVTFGSVIRYSMKPSRRWITINPLEDVKLPRNTTPKARAYLRYSEVEALADAARTVGGEQDALIVRTLAYTGLRVNELLAMRVEDVRASERRLIVSKSWTRVRGGQRIGTTKTGRTRRVPIPVFLMDDLAKQIGDRPGDAWLFVNSDGGHVSDANWRARIWVNAVAGSGLDVPGLTIHSLRHTYASLSIQAGATVKTLQAAMGHADATETLNTYADLWPETLDEVTDAITRQRERSLADSAIMSNHVSKERKPESKNPRKLNVSKG